MPVLFEQNRSCPAESAERARPSLATLTRTHWQGLVLTYALFAGENVLTLLQPWFLGRAVQGVMQNAILPAIVFLAVLLALALVSVCRRYYDTRFFTKIYSQLVSDWVISQRNKGRGVPQVVARATLARQMVQFLERDLPFLVHVSFQLIGTAVMLLLNEPWLFAGCLATVTIVALQYPQFARRTDFWSRHQHDQMEAEVTILETGDECRVPKHYHSLARCQVKLSDLEARQSAICHTLLVALTGVAFWFYFRNNWALGQFIALIGYLQLFSTGLLNLFPWAQQCIRLRDVIRRLREETP